MKPDYKSNHSIFGGHRSEFDQPIINRWPGDFRKRKVKITIGRFDGYDHYYVSIKAEPNPVWDEANKAWRTFRDEYEESERQKFDYFEKAEGWAKKIIKDKYRDFEPEWDTFY